ncbi:4Fe-4S binding protein [Desulfogranum japonicum]|uniref:4Fe-4S binding protein n=1 Tax=Desulfogranum japonicum TaxID=231447 RepID=UPI000406240E|nr:4Fe-4S binding protein [Desulfogranum japonicum]
MKVNQVKLVYFSPTGTTQKVMESIAKGLAIKNVKHINLTLPAESSQIYPVFSDELVIMGAPVYGGRIPVDAIKRFSQLKANDTLVIPVVVYGNRAFEDALLELNNLALELGFRPIAGGAFIGEHSFATKSITIANGRPDSLDVQKAIAFGAKIKTKVSDLQPSDLQIDLELPGSFPYEADGVRKLAVSPITKKDICTVCGTCASVCPTAAISVEEKVTTQTSLCIRCCACIKTCPEKARIMADETWTNIANWLQENCSTRKEPQVFGVEM